MVRYQGKDPERDKRIRANKRMLTELGEANRTSGNSVVAVERRAGRLSRRDLAEDFRRLRKAYKGYEGITALETRSVKRAHRQLRAVSSREASGEVYAEYEKTGKTPEGYRWVTIAGRPVLLKKGKK